MAWSQNFHVVACSGFGKEYPILVYFWEREGEINAKDFKYLMERVIKKEKEEFSFQENPDYNYNSNDFYEGNQENVRVGKQILSLFYYIFFFKPDEFRNYNYNPNPNHEKVIYLHIVNHLNFYLEGENIQKEGEKLRKKN